MFWLEIILLGLLFFIVYKYQRDSANAFQKLLIDGCLFTRRVQMAEYLSQGSDDSDLTDCDCFRLDDTAKALCR